MSEEPLQSNLDRGLSDDGHGEEIFYACCCLGEREGAAC